MKLAGFPVTDPQAGSIESRYGLVLACQLFRLALFGDGKWPLNLDRPRHARVRQLRDESGSRPGANPNASLTKPNALEVR